MMFDWPIGQALGAVAAQIERSPTPLREFLAALPGSWDMQLFIGFMMAGLFGMVAHFLLKWARDEIKGSLPRYLCENPKRLTLSGLTLVSFAMTAVANNMFATDFGVFVGWKLVLYTGWSAGFSIDVLVNRTPRTPWSFEERLNKISDKESRDGNR